VNIHFVNKGVKLSKVFKDTIMKFSRYAVNKLHISNDLYVYLMISKHKQKMSTAGYNPETNEVHVRVEGRALVDVLRSIAHEFGHARQKELGELDVPNIPNIGGPIEDHANAAAGRLIKMYIKDTGHDWIYKV
jgi:hypothetical protein